jgi:ribonuclease VapC
VLLEAAMRLAAKLKIGIDVVTDELQVFLADTRADVVAIQADDGWRAIQAFQRYGKGRGHPAQLNLADCLSYACAKNRGMKLLYKGNDLAATDLA